LASRSRKSDFPDDRWYSRERIWIARAPIAGAYRVGVVFPAFAPPAPGGRPATAYFVQILEEAALTAGRPFGVIETEIARLDLVAPVSARLVRSNPALAADPGLVSADPFGEGWLCELTRVSAEALERLFDRDSFCSYLRFEAEARRLGLQPILGARMRFEAGDPSPRELRVELGGRLIARGRRVLFGRNKTFTPQWSKGERWKVRCHVLQPSLAMLPPELAKPQLVERNWDFEVLDDEADLAGTPCYVVKAVEAGGGPPQIFYRLSIAREDFTLRKIEEVSTFNPRWGSSAENGWGADSYLELREARELIVDLPLFPEEDLPERRLVTAPGVPAFEQKTSFPSPTTMRIVCEAGPEENGLRSEQTWERGLPWWKSARRTAGGAVLMTGELLS
jgi:glycine cleavage system H protein